VSLKHCMGFYSYWCCGVLASIQLTLGKISNTSAISKTRWPGQGSQAVLENSGSYISGLYDLAFGSYAA
jgi:hypothetical protein